MITSEMLGQFSMWSAVRVDVEEGIPGRQHM
jgi:hypothetical protein